MTTPDAVPAVTDADDPSGDVFSDLFDGESFAAVLFDMDGTLVDSTASVERSWLQWAGEFDVPLDRLVGWHGVPARQIVEAVVDAPRRAAAFARIEEIEVEDAADGVLLLDGAAAALAALPRGRSAIVTSCTERLAWARIRAARIDPPAVVVTASDVAVGKPDPAPYLLGARRLGVAAQRCLVVEDAPAGLRSARSAGARTLGLLTTHTRGDLDAHAVVDTLAAVLFVPAPDGIRVVAVR